MGGYLLPVTGRKYSWLSGIVSSVEWTVDNMSLQLGYCRVIISISFTVVDLLIVFSIVAKSPLTIAKSVL